MVDLEAIRTRWTAAMLGRWEVVPVEGDGVLVRGIRELVGDLVGVDVQQMADEIEELREAIRVVWGDLEGSELREDPNIAEMAYRAGLTDENAT